MRAIIMHPKSKKIYQYALLPYCSLSSPVIHNHRQISLPPLIKAETELCASYYGPTWEGHTCYHFAKHLVMPSRKQTGGVRDVQRWNKSLRMALPAVLSDGLVPLRCATI